MKRRLTYHLIAGMLTLAATLAVVIGLRSWLWKQEDYRNLGGQNALLGAQITQFVLEKAVDNGLFDRETLFRAHYDPVGQRTPARYRTEYDGFFDRDVAKILKAFQAHGEVYYACVVNNDGFIAAHTDPAKSKTMLAEPGLGAPPARGDPGDRLVKSDRGYEFREFRAPIVVGGRPWGEFRVGIPVALTYHRARISGLSTFGITLLFSLVFVGAIVWLIRRSLRPLEELTRATRQMATGDTLARCNYGGNDELGALARSFNAMAETISQTQESLERQVHTRTAELASANAAMIVEIAERTKAEESARLARDASEAANRAKSEFLANMSHEIRTPMTAILGFLDIVAEAVDGPEQQEAVETIKRNSHHLLSLINDILDLSKIESGKLQMETVPTSPAAILADVVSLMRVRAEAQGLALKLKYVGPIPETIFVDPTRLRQILVNLVGNAIKFTETGEVGIVARLLDRDSASPKFQCEVVDTGIGIEPEHIDRLFQAFQQADNSTTRKFGGTGLGLAISKRLAGLLGGDITVRSEPGRGSTFTLTLAAGSLAGVGFLEHAAEAVTKPGGGRAAVAASPARLHGRILLAEDGPDNQRLISFILRKAGAEVVVCENGHKALDKALPTISGRGRRHDDSSTPFDVILMDMQMPVMDGYEATRRLRQHGYCRPILALTAHAMKDDRQKCLDAGCDDYLTKPIVREQFLRTIAGYLGAGDPAGELAVTAGGGAMTAKILIVDDDSAFRRLVVRVLRQEYTLEQAEDGAQALRVLDAFAPDVVLLDISMPGIDGYETCRRIKATAAGQRAQVIMVSGQSSRDEQLRAYEQGADDYLVKPIDVQELRCRARLHVRMRDALQNVSSIRQEIASRNQEIKQLAEQRARDLLLLQDVVVYTLAKVAESRDSDTGGHVLRVRSYCQLLAEGLRENGPYRGQIDGQFLDDLYRASPLHDIGKVAISDEILLKPGRLTAAEFQRMQRHTVIGAGILEEAIEQSPYAGFLAMAAVVARYHHERYDGSGYLVGLAGLEIPLPARILAVADAYDAITSARPYKAAESPLRAREIIQSESGRHFDPVIVEAFHDRFAEFLQVGAEQSQSALPVVDAASFCAQEPTLIEA